MKLAVVIPTRNEAGTIGATGNTQIHLERFHHRLIPTIRRQASHVMRVRLRTIATVLTATRGHNRRRWLWYTDQKPISPATTRISTVPYTIQ